MIWILVLGFFSSFPFPFGHNLEEGEQVTTSRSLSGKVHERCFRVWFFAFDTQDVLGGFRALAVAMLKLA